MINIRRGCFETNSSSVHSLSMCMKDEYDEWENGNIYYNKDSHWNGYPEFLTKDEAMRCLKENNQYSYNHIIDDNLNHEDIDEVFRDCGIYSYDKFYDDIDMETFYDEFTTPAGEDVVAFGYYGYDC